LVNDIAILKELSHPGILRIFEFYSDPKYFYVASEFIVGGELFERFSKIEKFSEKEAANGINLFFV